jgi:hypothetical protein
MKHNIREIINRIYIAAYIVFYGSILIFLIEDSSLWIYINDDNFYDVMSIYAYFYLRINHYVYNNPKFRFVDFLISIVIQILIIFIVTSSIYMVNIQNFLTINDDKSLQYICVFISIIVISLIYVKKIQKDGLKKTLVNGFFLISSYYLLRLNLIYCIPFVLPLTSSELAVKILTTRLNLITYILDDITNSEFLFSVKSKLLDIGSAIINYCMPEARFDGEWGDGSTSINEWKAWTELKPELNQIEINERAMSIFEFFKVKIDPRDRQTLYKLDFTKVELDLLKHVKCVKGIGDCAVMVCPEGKEIYPVNYQSLFFDLNACQDPTIAPFPTSEHYNIPVYKLKTPEDTEEWVPGFKHVVLEHLYFQNMSELGNSIDIYSPQGYVTPVFISDWSLNSKIFIKWHQLASGTNRYSVFNPRLKDSKGYGEFCIKLEFKGYNQFIPLGVNIPHKPCQMMEIRYNSIQSLNNQYFLSTQRWLAGHLKTKSKALNLQQRILTSELKQLKYWNGTNNTEYNPRLTQSSKLYVSPVFSAEALNIIESWRRSN